MTHFPAAKRIKAQAELRDKRPSRRAIAVKQMILEKNDAAGLRAYLAWRGSALREERVEFVDEDECRCVLHCSAERGRNDAFGLTHLGTHL